LPQDIPSASQTKDPPPESESPKVDKPPSPSTGQSSQKMLKPPGPEVTDIPTGAKGDSTFSSTTDSGHDAAHQSPRPEPIEHTEASPQNPKSFGLGAPGGPQPDEGSSVHRSKKQQRQYSHVVEFLWDNPDIIQAGFHID
jgi:hypothetical protein